MRRLVASLFVVAALVGSGGSAARTRALPSLDYVRFPAALQRLHDAGFAVEVPYFPPFSAREPAEQGRGRLSNYVVVRARRLSGDVVALTLTLPRFEGPFGSLAGRKGEPAFLSTPNLVGRSYEAVANQAADYTTSGYWLRIGTVAPLEPSRSGIDKAFRIASQSPPPGKRILFAGVLPNHHGIWPAKSTITVSLTTGGKTTAAEASTRARRALRAAAAETFRPFPHTATAGSCRIRAGGPISRHVYGRCFTGVDLSGKDAVVVYRQLWDGRDFRSGNAPARPDLEHVWEVTVSPAGKVLAVKSFGAGPPQAAG
jgi:hypothetical protein